MAEPVGARVFVRGRVQGVGFRYHTRARARELGVRGWVRNLHDGRVEVWAEGTESACAALCTWLQDGPPGASVTECAVLPESASETTPAEFEIRPSR